MDAYYEKAFGMRRGQPIVPQVDPNKPITVDDVARISAYNAEQVRVSMARDVAQARSDAIRAQQAVADSHTAATRSALESQMTSHINALLEKHPVLRKFEHIDEDLIGDASRFNPRSLDDAKVRLTEAAERRVAVIRAIADEGNKRVAADAAKLKQHSTEAPGGAAPRPAPARTLSLSARDRKDLLAAAEADMRSFLGQT